MGIKSRIATYLVVGAIGYWVGSCSAYPAQRNESPVQTPTAYSQKSEDLGPYTKMFNENNTTVQGSNNENLESKLR